MLVQGWQPEKQREFLHGLPASVATEPTLQLLVQSAHKWVYTPPPPAADLDDPDEADLDGGAAEPKQETGKGFDGEYDEDEESIREEMEAARAEVAAAAAAIVSLPFEDKVKLVAAVPPRSAAVLIGAVWLPWSRF